METNTDKALTGDSRNFWSQCSHNLKSSLVVCTTSAFGAYAQWQVELSKVLNPSLEPGKFPEGMKSFNSAEELLEGGISSAAGAIFALLLYRRYCKMNSKDVDLQTEVECIVFGAVLGYSLMAFVAGPIWHNIAGVPDTKWGPFK